MSSRTLLCLLAGLSIGWSVSAQTPVPQPKPARKPAIAKPATAPKPVDKAAVVAPPAPPPPAAPAASSAAASSTAAAAAPKGGVISETVTLTDTGERKQMFGLEARHIKTAIVRQPGENACESKTTRVETDGWYADLPAHSTCAAA